MELSGNMADAELVSNLKSGTQVEASIRAIYRMNFETLSRWIMQNSGSRQDAEDIFQEVFIRVVDTLRNNRYSEEGKFLPWIMRIAHNLCIDHFRVREFRFAFPFVTILARRPFSIAASRL